jgi:PAS domain S-box-containing protein
MDEKTIASNQLFRSVAEASPNGVFLTDPVGRILFANRRLLDLLGMTAGEVDEEQAWLERFHLEDLDAADRAWRDGIENRRAWSYECRLAAAESDLKWIRVVGYPHYTDDGGLLGFCGSVEDITERIGNEATARKNEQRWRRLVD